MGIGVPHRCSRADSRLPRGGVRQLAHHHDPSVVCLVSENELRACFWAKILRRCSECFGNVEHHRAMPSSPRAQPSGLHTVVKGGKAAGKSREREGEMESGCGEEEGEGN